MKHPGQPSEVAPPAQSPSKESKSESDPTTTTALADSPKKKSTLNPGVYTLINAQSGTVIDLSVMDHKTVVGFPRHNGDNQQWRLVLLGPGYIIQSISSGEYLTLKEGITHGAALSVSTFPVLWKVDAYEEEDELFVQIFWPSETLSYVLELAGGDTALFTKIQLASYQHDQRHQLWRVAEVDRWEEQSQFKSGAHTPVSAQSDTVLPESSIFERSSIDTADNEFPPPTAARTPCPGAIHSGTFHIESIRPVNQPRQDNRGTIYFTPPISTAYNLLLGINALDIGCSADFTLKCNLLSVANNSVQLNLQSWGNTVQYSSGCAWLRVPTDDLDFQSGRFSATDYYPWWSFWLDSIHTDANTDCRIHVYANDITADGFTIHLDTWNDTKLYLAGATWAAYSADRVGIRSGSFCAGDARNPTKLPSENSAQIAFDGADFRNTPRVFMALNLLYVDCKHNTRLKPICATNVTNAEMTWHIDTYLDTILYAAGASFVACDW
ncbi:hypothetical protein EW026_g6600 [Hermanssonia centrifuga]|uniref:Ricin B lectin domain-containing protein n=1 Tax=Hermanssonia centrifuga TaxID=98765 RepID=A0A4S4KAG9_9APHY|nr:hypothetical protein EW026_g6600 [Hermanssonia centrifuga]